MKKRVRGSNVIEACYFAGGPRLARPATSPQWTELGTPAPRFWPAPSLRRSQCLTIEALSRGHQTENSDFLCLARLASRLLRAAVAIFILLALFCFGVFAYFYVKYDQIITKKMSGQIFSTSAKIYSRSITVHAGDPFTPAQIAAILRRAGYLDAGTGADAPMGTYRMVPGGIEVLPGAESYHSTDGARILDGADGRVAQILSAGSNSGAPLESYELEPELVTALFQGQDRTKRETSHLQRDSQGDGGFGAGHRGPQVLRARRHQLAQPDRIVRHRPARRGQAARRIDPDHAAFARLLPEPAEDLSPQADRDADCHRAGAEAQQAADLRDVCQPGLSGAARIVFHQRLWRGLALLLRQGHQGDHPARGGHDRRHHPVAQLSQSLQASRQGDGAAQRGAGLDGRNRRHHPRPGRRRQGHPAQAQRAQRGSQRRSLFCRSGQGHPVQRAYGSRPERKRLSHLHHARPGSAARRRRGRLRRHQAGGRPGGQAANPPGEGGHRPRCQGRAEHRLRSDPAGGAGGAGPAYRRGAGPGGRQKLRLQPAGSRRRQASHRLHLQALRLCRGDEFGAHRAGHRPGLHPDFADRRFAHRV